MDIGQGAGLAGATGLRPFLPPLLAGALARGDIGVDFDGSGWRFLESPGFLLGLFALAVIWYLAERSLTNQAESDRKALHPPHIRAASTLIGVGLGALLFAGSLAESGHSAVLGLLAGIVCALLARVSLGALFERATQRLGAGNDLLALYAEGAALLIAAIAIFVPPLAFLALAGMVLLLAKGRGQGDRKYAGLRVLR